MLDRSVGLGIFKEIDRPSFYQAEISVPTWIQIDSVSQHHARIWTRISPNQNSGETCRILSPSGHNDSNTYMTNYSASENQNVCPYNALQHSKWLIPQKSLGQTRGTPLIIINISCFLLSGENIPDYFYIII